MHELTLEYIGTRIHYISKTGLTIQHYTALYSTIVVIVL
jgi:hypothetical protein